MCESVIAKGTIASFRAMMAESQEGLDEVIQTLGQMARQEFLGFSFQQRLYSLILAGFRDEMPLLLGISYCAYCERFVFPEAPHIWCEKGIERFINGEEPVTASVEDYSCTNDFDDGEEPLAVAAYQPQYSAVYYMYT